MSLEIILWYETPVKYKWSFALKIQSHNYFFIVYIWPFRMSPTSFLFQCCQNPDFNQLQSNKCNCKCTMVIHTNSNWETANSWSLFHTLMKPWQSWLTPLPLFPPSPHFSLLVLSSTYLLQYNPFKPLQRVHSFWQSDELKFFYNK